MNKKIFDEGLVLQCTNEEQLKDKILIDQFTEFIHNLISNDFEKLVNLLYRIDVDESKLRYLLSLHQNEDSAKIIAEMIINRQLQKIQFRRSITQEGESDEEKW